MKQESAHAFSVKNLLLAIASCLSLVPPVSNVGLFWFALLGFALSLISDARRAIDHLVLFTAVALGFLPFFGWFSLPAWVNPLGVLVATYLFTAISNFGISRLSSPGNVLSITPAATAGILSYQWWCGLSKGTPEAVLERLLPIWDLSAHFNFFFSSLVSGQYLPRIPIAEGASAWSGQEYPSGIHYLFGLFARQNKDKIIENPESAIPIFANSIVVALAFSIFVAAICGWRLAEKRLFQFSYSAITAGLACALITLGPISQSISTGFANMPAVLIPLFILVSTHLRPLRNSNQQLVVVTACVAAIAFNWYPIAVLISPLVATQFWRVKNDGIKLNGVVASLAIIVLVAPPVIQTLSLGVSHLDLSGGIQPFPPGLLVTFLFASFSVAIGSSLSSRVRIDFVTANIVPFIFAVTFFIWSQTRPQGYSYYFHKSMLFVAVYSAMTVLYSVLRLCSNFESKLQPKVLHQWLPMAIGSIVLGVGLSQMLGYWGPNYPSFSGASTAYGVLNRNEITKRSQHHLENSKQILETLSRTRNLPFFERECVVLVVPADSEPTPSNNYAPSIAVLTNIWYHALSQSYTETAAERTSLMAGLPSYTDEASIAESIEAMFDSDFVCIYSTAGVLEVLNAGNTQWNLHRL